MLAVFFPPREVLEAKHWLKQNNPRQAAHALLRARDPDHKDVVACKKKVAEKLIAVARQEYANEALWASNEAVTLAKKLAPLNGEDAAFAEQVMQAWQRKKNQEEALQAVEQEARRLLSERQYQSVLSLLQSFLGSLTGQTLDAARMRLLDLLAKAQAAQQRVESLVHQIEQHLERGEYEAAQRVLVQLRDLIPPDDFRYEQLRKDVEEALHQREFQHWIQEAQRAVQNEDLPRALACWRRVDELRPDDPEVRRLVHEVHQLEQRLRHRKICMRICERTQRFVLARHWLVVSASAAVLGLDSQATVPLLGQLHRQHARIFRDYERYQILPCRDRHGQLCAVYVNGMRIDRPYVLQHGDWIAFGESPKMAVCFRFQQPIQGSGTALLLGNETGRIRAPQQACSHVVLLDDAVTFAPQSEPGHACWQELPCSFRLVWKEAEGLVWETRDGEVLLPAEGGEFVTRLCTGPVYVPSKLELTACEDPEMSETKWLEGQFKGRTRARWQLEFAPAE